MIQTAEKAILTRGIYTPKQAARYARLRTQTLRRWIHGSGSGDAAVRAELTGDPDDFVTFLDLVQALSVRSIRLDDKFSVPLQRIRRVVDLAAEKYGIEYPLAHRHTTYLFEDDIVIRLQDDTLVQITGKYKDHHCIQSVIEFYAEDLHFDESGRACRYEPMKYNGRTIVLDPTIRFGEPIVAPCGYAVDVLVTALRTEGSYVRAARAYEVDADDIKVAERYYDWLLGVAA